MRDLEHITKKAAEIIDLAWLDVFADHLKSQKSLTIELKHGYEVVSEVDKLSSEFLIERLEKILPGVPAISEESPPEAFRRTPERFWLIDPLDGTQNFIRGIPHATICVSLVEAGIPVIGVTKNIYTGDLYYAWQGGGFYRNRARAYRVPNSDGKTILSTGFAHDKSLHAQHLRNLIAVLPHFTDMRRFASFGMDMCWLCEGRLDASFEILAPWDFYAGWAMAKQVGLVCHVSGGEAPLDRRRYFVCGDQETVDFIRGVCDLTIR